MPRLKIKPEPVGMQPDSRPCPPAPPLVTAHADMPAHQSPALALQTRLEHSWQARHDHHAPTTAKIPFGWTLVGMSVTCAAAWYLILRLVF